MILSVKYKSVCKLTFGMFKINIKKHFIGDRYYLIQIFRIILIIMEHLGEGGRKGTLHQATSHNLTEPTA